MTVLSGQTIQRLGIIQPCLFRTEEPYGHKGRKVSYGLGPAGYDLRLDLGGEVSLRHVSPGEFILVAAQEYFIMPNNVLGVVHDKSSWARLGLTVQNTVIEPGWRGYLTLELHNQGRSKLYLPRGIGIAQVIFHTTDEPVQFPYSGKYQDQPSGPQEAR